MKENFKEKNKKGNLNKWRALSCFIFRERKTQWKFFPNKYINLI